MREQVTAADCRSCGACCGAADEDEGAASVDATDRERMGQRRVQLYVLGSTTAAQWKRQRSGPCAGREALLCSALRGSLFERVSCAMYDVRPSVCRDFVPGSDRCLAVRRLMREAMHDG
jgi:Fe-S-cluster containining protein